MRFSVNKSLLLKHLFYVQGVIDTRSTMLILSHVLFLVKDGRLFLSSTDLESTSYTSLPINAEEDGAVCLPAKKILEITEKITDEDVKISTNKTNQLEVVHTTGTTKIKTLPAEDFPQIPKPEDFTYVATKSATLSSLIQKTAYAVGGDGLRKNLTGVFFDMTTPGKIRLVATDGHRMSIAEEELENNTQESFVLSKKAANELKKFIKDTEIVQIGIGKSFFVCDNGQTSILSRLIDVDFPEYNQVLPRDLSNTFKVERKKLLESLQRVSVVLSDKARGARMLINKNEIEIRSTSDEGETTETIQISEAQNNTEAGFNVKYLIEALSSFEEEEVFFCVTDEVSPACIYSNKDNTHKQLSVVMPMRV